MTWVAKTLHTTPTGRAKSVGKTTRRSHSVRGTKYAKGVGQDRPLPMHKQVHPMALTRTSRNPGCAKGYGGQYNVKDLLDNMTCKFDYMVGHGLHVQAEDGMWRVVLAHTGITLGYAECGAALAYRNAAAHFDVQLEVYDE